jgi:hypothetical protein
VGVAARAALGCAAAIAVAGMLGGLALCAVSAQVTGYEGGFVLDVLLTRTLVTFGGAASIGLGVWHFFVPRIWDWYSYIDPSATELVLAVRAINVFFSLSLVLFGSMNLLMAYGRTADRYSVLVVLGATCVLWATRVVMQLAYPQGSASAALQYGMLLLFVLVLACYSASLALVLVNRSLG